MTELNMPEMERRLEKAEQQFSVLREIGLALESTMTFDEILTMAVEKTTRLMGAERSTLFLVNSDGDLLSRVIEGDDVNEIRLAPGQGIAGWAARHARPLIVTDTSLDERFDPTWDEKTGFVTRDIMCHPILGRHGTVIGVAEVLNRIDGTFDQEDLEILGLLCGQLALTVENSVMMIDLVEKNRAITNAKIDVERRNRELNLLLDLERLVARAEDLDSLAVSILGRVLKICDAGVAILHSMDDNGAQIRVLTADAKTGRVIRVDAGRGFCGWVSARGQELLIDEPAGDPRFQSSIEKRVGIPLKNLAAVPLPFLEDRNMRGALLVANRGSGVGFTEPDLMLLRLVAAQLASAMDHLSDRVVRERERRLATVGRLLAGVLHDLKSPITVVSGYAEMLAARVDTQEGDEYVEHVNAALDRITRMAAEIIAFSRGERRVLPSNCLLPEFVDEFKAQVEQHLKSNGVELEIHLRTAGSVRLDTEKMIRAFNNIAINAAEAMVGGGKMIFEVDRLGDELIFSFTDTGPGIPDEIQGSLFQSFVTLGKENGTGLGLAVAREIVEAHGGKINFTTVRGGGTTFLVSIPVQ